MSDCLIVGAGVVGLSLAYELARGGARVRLLDAGPPGAEASWAGAGILPPAGSQAADPRERFVALSNQLHTEWHSRLREETGIDNGLRHCGGIYLSRSALAAEQQHATAADWRRDGVAVEQLTGWSALGELEPALAARGELLAAYHLPDERQIRNPWHLKSLIAACQRHGVEMHAHTPALGFVTRGERLTAVETPAGPMDADRFCITSGVWSRALVEQLGTAPPMRPVRGQIALVSLPNAPLSRVINEGRRYLVPRGDGRVLVGSTEEDAGFDRSTTAEGIAGLLEFAVSLCPPLAQAQVERCWAGLRPASIDGWPYLGRIEPYSNAFLAAGHFRSGLQLSTGTALVLAALMGGEPAPVELGPYALERSA